MAIYQKRFQYPSPPASRHLLHGKPAVPVSANWKWLASLSVDQGAAPLRIQEFSLARPLFVDAQGSTLVRLSLDPQAKFSSFTISRPFTPKQSATVCNVARDDRRESGGTEQSIGHVPAHRRGDEPVPPEIRTKNWSDWVFATSGLIVPFPTSGCAVSRQAQLDLASLAWPHQEQYTFTGAARSRIPSAYVSGSATRLL